MPDVDRLSRYFGLAMERGEPAPLLEPEHADVVRLDREELPSALAIAPDHPEVCDPRVGRPGQHLRADGHVPAGFHDAVGSAGRRVAHGSVAGELWEVVGGEVLPRDQPDLGRRHTPDYRTARAPRQAHFLVDSRSRWCDDWRVERGTP